MSQNPVQRLPEKRRAEVTYVQPAEVDLPVETASSSTTAPQDETQISPLPSPTENTVANETKEPPTETAVDATVVQRTPSQEKFHGIHSMPGSAPEQTIGDTQKTVAAKTGSSVSPSEATLTDTPTSPSLDAIQRSTLDEAREPVGGIKGVQAEDSPSGRQSTPLQDAWPVQQLDHPENWPAQPSQVDEPFRDSSEPTQIHPSLSEDPQRTMISGQPEQSLPNPETMESRSTAIALHPPAATIQREPETELEGTRISQKGSADPTNDFQPGAGPASYVETSVGPLPADLWTILDKEPPRSATGQATMLDPTSSVPAQAGTMAPPFTTGSPATSTIQRQPMESAPQTQTRSTQPANTASASETGNTSSNSSPDIEILARQVYAILRRRLITEWERMRR